MQFREGISAMKRMRRLHIGPASRGDYEDLGGPAVEAWLRQAVAAPFDVSRRIIPDGTEPVRNPSASKPT